MLFYSSSDPRVIKLFELSERSKCRPVHSKLECWLVVCTNNDDDHCVVKLDRCSVKWYGTLNISGL